MPIRTVEYVNRAGESLLLDIHPTTNGEAAAAHPAVVLVHGGGWSGGSRTDDLPLIAEISSAGLVVFSIDYRLAPQHRWPACVEDVQAAIRWVSANAGQYGADARKLGLVGYSAGGHLACHAAVIDRSPNVSAVALLAAPTDHVLDCLRRGGLSPSLKNLLGREELDSDTLDLLWQISPINFVVPGLPPFLLLNGTEDQSVPHAQSAHLHQRLSDLGVQSDLVSLKGAGHRMREWKQADPDFGRRVGRWLAAELKA